MVIHIQILCAILFLILVMLGKYVGELILKDLQPKVERIGIKWVNITFGIFCLIIMFAYLGFVVTLIGNIYNHFTIYS